MIKLATQSELNSPTEYDRIFAERQKKGVDEHDVRRWKRLLKYYKGGRLVDLGALDSEINKLIEKPWLNYDGIDLASEAMKERDKERRGNFWVRNLYYTTFQAETFEYAILGEVLEHLERPEDAIKEAMRILKPGGVLAISVPLEEAREPGSCDKDRHLWSFSKQDMKEMLLPYGKVELDTVGSLFTWKPPFYRYCWPSLCAWVWKK